MNSLKMASFEWLNISKVKDELLLSFDSGSSLFNDFLQTKAREWQDAGEAATYVIVDTEQLDCPNRIYGYVSISALGLLNIPLGDNTAGSYLSCAEIRMFAISKVLRRRGNATVQYSDAIFRLILQNLYEMSTKVIGFRGIYLNANHEGYDLYLRCGFSDLSEYVAETDDEKIDLTDTMPMLIHINDYFMDKVFS